jgi:hypothetical protein
MFGLDFLKKREGVARGENSVGTEDGAPILLEQ